MFLVPFSVAFYFSHVDDTNETKCCDKMTRMPFVSIQRARPKS